MIYLDTKTGNLTDEQDLAVALTGEPGYSPEVHSALCGLLERGDLVALPFASLALPEAA